MSTFTGGGDPASPAESPEREATPEEAAQTAAKSDQAPDKLRVKARMTTIAFILHEERSRLATLALSAGDVSVLLNGPTMRISARLGNLSLDDDSQTSGDSAFRSLLRIEGDNLADFQYETFDRSDPTYPGHDSKVWLRSGSLHFTVVDQTLHRLLIFMNQFAQMKAVMDRAGEAAKQASELTQNQTKMHVDILIRSPIVTFPRQYGSNDRLRANLGEISLHNEFSGPEDQLVTKYIAGLHNVRLTSDFYHDEVCHTLQVLEDVNFDVVAASFANVDRKKNLQAPDSDVSSARVSMPPLLIEAFSDRRPRVGRQDAAHPGSIPPHHEPRNLYPPHLRHFRRGCSCRDKGRGR